MSGLAAIVISSTQYASALMSRTSIDGSVLDFSDDEPLKAIAAITQHQPPLVVLERFFAATPRGAALINRIKSDPSLTATVIKVVAHDSAYSRVIPRRPTADTATAPKPAPDPGPPAAEPRTALDAEGTRIAPRIQLQRGTQLHLGGSPVVIVDLSNTGAQVISPHALRPNDQFDAVLSNEDEDTLQFEARVVWANFEAPGGQAQYRAGLAFSGADPNWVDQFSLTNRSV